MQFIKNYVRILSLNHLYVLLLFIISFYVCFICMLYNSYTLGKRVLNNKFDLTFDVCKNDIVQDNDFEISLLLVKLHVHSL